MDWETVLDEKYSYSANVVSVYDGDTITCDIKLGFNVVLSKQKIRLYGINTPEIRGEEKPQGYISRDRLRELILEKEIKLYTKRDKKGKYGRWLGIIMLDNQNINQLLVDENLAIIKIY